MRKEAKTRKQVECANIQGYHQSGYGENYAFSGFTGNWYFNSDRCIALSSTYTRADNQPLQGYGIEIEAECQNITSERALAEVFEKIIFPTFKFGKKMFKMQHDGSLGGETSVEVISQVMTKGRIRNDYSAYKVMYDEWFNAFGICSDSTYTECGMHVNVSNAVFGKTKEEQEESIRKLYYLINRYYQLMCKLFHRADNKTQWCRQMTEEHLRWHESSSLDASAFDWHNARNLDFSGRLPSSHANCVNLSHYNDGRIEIRIVGGQGDYYCFRNTMESVFFLTEKVRKLSWEDLEDIKKVFKGCNQYVFKRLVSCVGRNGLDADVLHAIELNVNTEDLELR